MFYMQDKHSYKTGTLNDIHSKAELCRTNSKNEVKLLSDILKWWIITQTILLGCGPQIFAEST